MKTRKKIGIVVLSVIIILIIVAFGIFKVMEQGTEEAVSNMVNEDIDMLKVKDGTYEGKSGGGLINVEVEVEVKEHRIKDIQIIRHDNGRGKAAEAIVDEMVLRNTDNVDTISGATLSSLTVRNAVNVALQKGMK